MSSPTWLLAICVLAWIADASLCITLWRKNLLSNWPVLFTAGIVHISGSVILLAVHRDYALYFYCFWFREALLAILRIVILGDIFRAIPGMSFVPRQARRLALYLTAVIAIGAVTLTWQGHPSLTIVPLALLLNRCVNVVWGATTLGGVLLLVATGFAIPRTPLQVAAGYLTLIVGGLVVSAAYSAPFFWMRLAANGADAVLLTVVLAFWTFEFSKPPERVNGDEVDLLEALLHVQ